MKTVLEYEGEQIFLTHPCIDCGAEISSGSLCEPCLLQRAADYEDDGDCELEDEFEDDCGLAHDGQCSMAGTEHCDFECPNRDSELFCGSTAWRKKHGED